MITHNSPHSRVATTGDADSAPPARRHLPVGRTAILVPLYLFLIAGWLRAGVEKVIDPSWWTGEYLVGFLDEQQPHMLPFFAPFADHVLEPLAPVVAWIVVWMQLAIPICLITNRYARPALWAGIVLNLCFTMAGRVNPSAFYLVMEVTLLFALSRPIGPKIALRRAALWLVPAALFAPFARTVHPADVIDDPALMLSFLSLVAAVTTVAIVNRPAELIETAASTPIGRRIVRRTGISPHELHERFTAERSSSSAPR